MAGGAVVSSGAMTLAAFVALAAECAPSVAPETLADAAPKTLAKRATGACGVAYLITNTINEKRYVGVTRYGATRFTNHRSAALRGSAFALHRAMAKYGLDAFQFEIIASAPTWKDLLALERILIAQHQTHVSSNGGYNLTFGGEGVLGHRHSEQTKAKQRAASSGKTVSEGTRARLRSIHLGKKKPKNSYAHRIGVPLAGDTKQKISAALTGRTITAEQRDRMIAAVRTDEARERRRKANLGRKASAETRAKMRAAHTGAVKSPETKEKIRQANVLAAVARYASADRETHPRAKLVNTPAGVFSSLILAAEHHGMHRKTVRRLVVAGLGGWSFAGGTQCPL